jgi:regulator of replication initiation timing
MNDYDKRDIYDAIHEIERYMNKIEYLVKSYKKIIINNILRNQDIQEMLELLERLNNAQTPKTS